MASFLHEGREPIYTPPEQATLEDEEDGLSEQEEATLRYLLAKYARAKTGFIHEGRKPIVPCSDPHSKPSDDNIVYIADAIQRRF